MSAKDGAKKNPVAVAFGSRVSSLRGQRGLTQKELARRASYDPITLSKLENGEVVAKIDTAKRIATALGVDVGDLFADNAIAVERFKQPVPDRLERVEGLAAEVPDLSRDLEAVVIVLEELLSGLGVQRSFRELIAEQRQLL